MKKVKWQSVDSSNIDGLSFEGYKHSSSEREKAGLPLLGYLLVKFKNGSIYKYIGVPKELYQELITTEGSVGGLFNVKVKNGGFSFVKIQDKYKSNEKKA